MTRIADLADLGYLPAQTLDSRHDLAVRPAIFAGRIERRGKAAELGRYVLEDKSAGDVLGAVMFPRASRPISAWFFSAPATVGSVAGNTAKVRPARDEAWTPDDRLQEIDAGLPAFSQRFPRGWGGTVQGAAQEFRQAATLSPGFFGLVAVNRAGDPDRASLVSDLAGDDRIDLTRQARLHSAWRVVRQDDGVLPLRPANERVPNALAWQLNVASRDSVPGYGFVVGKGSPPADLSGHAGGGPPPQTVGGLVYALAGSKAFGPLDEGEEGDQHEIARTLDGEAINTCHLFTGVPWHGPVGDGPIDFEDEPYSEPDEQPLTVRAHLRWDGRKQHPWVGGPRGGMWRLESEAAVAIPPPPPPPPWIPEWPGKITDGPGGGPGDPPQTPPPPPRWPRGGGPGRPPITDDGTLPTPGPPQITDGPTGRATPEVAGPTPEQPRPTITDDGSLPTPGLPTPEPGPVQPPHVGPDTDPPEDPPHYRKPRTGTPFTPRKPTDGHDVSAASTVPLSVPGLSLRPRDYGGGMDDLTGARSPTATQVRENVGNAPVTLNLDAWFGGLGPLGVSYTEKPSIGKHAGGTAAGGLAFLPPEIDLGMVFSGDPLPDYSRATVVPYLVDFGYGTPLKGGGVDGFVTRKTGSILTIYETSTTGVVGTAALEIDKGTGTVRAYGATVGAATTPWVYGGDGSDGAAVFDGAGAVTGASRSGSVYTLTKNTSYTDATISAGVTVKTNGLLFAGTGTLTNAGKVERNGGDATSSAGGSAPGGTQGLGLAGATGRTTSGNGTGGSSFSNALGGSGGNGGATGGSTGGTGGTATRPSNDAVPPYNTIQATAQNGRMVSLSAVLDPSGGGSGGAGGFEVGAVGRSGSGGASAGNLQIAFKTIICTGAGTIEAKGGNAYVAAGTGDMGGGGGGGGGCIRMIAQSYTGCTSGTTVLVAKGLKSNGIGAGANGTDGADGQVFMFSA